MRKSDLRKLFRLVQFLTGFDPAAILEEMIQPIVKKLLQTAFHLAKRWAKKVITMLNAYNLK